MHQHVRTSLLHTISIHKSEITSLDLIDVPLPAFGRIQPGRNGGVMYPANRHAHARCTWLVSTTRLTRNDGFCPKGLLPSGRGAGIRGLGIDGTTDLSSTPDAARWLSVRYEGPWLNRQIMGVSCADWGVRARTG